MLRYVDGGTAYRRTQLRSGLGIRGRIGERTGHLHKITARTGASAKGGGSGGKLPTFRARGNFTTIKGVWGNTPTFIIECLY